MQMQAMAMGAIATIGLASQANAASLGLTSGIPDLKANVNVSYQGTLFKASGSNLMMTINTDSDSAIEYDTNGEGVYDLQAQIDATGHLISGTVTITGSLYNDDLSTFAITNPSTVLLQGNLVDFGPSVGTGAAEFQFKFNNISGPLTALGFTGVGGIKISGTGAQFAGSFANFSQVALNLDTIAVPVPSPASLGGGVMLMTGLAAVRSRSRRRDA